MVNEPATMANGSACERCGTFAELWSLTPRLCPACQQRLVAEKPFWTSAYLIGLGAVLNPTGAAVLASLNFRRLGDAKAARTWTLVAVVFGVFYGVLIAADLPIPNQVLWPAGVFAGWFIGKQWDPTWTVLKKLGAKRASGVLPVVLLLVILIAYVVVVAVVSELLHPTPPEY